MDCELKKLHRPSRLNELREMSLELFSKREAVKAARARAVQMKTNALAKRAALVKARVAAVKEMKAIKPVREISSAISHRKNPPPQRLSTPSHQPAPPQIISTELSTHAVKIVIEDTDTNVKADFINTSVPVITVKPVDDDRARIREMKAAKARMAIARLTVTQAVEESSAVSIFSNIIDTVIATSEVNAIRRQKAIHAIATLALTEQTRVEEVRSDITSLQATAAQFSADFRSIGVIIKRIKANSIFRSDVNEMIEHEPNALTKVIPTSRRKRYIPVPPSPPWKYRRVQHSRRLLKRKYLVYQSPIPRLGLFKVNLLHRLGKEVMGFSRGIQPEYKQAGAVCQNFVRTVVGMS